MANAAPLRQQLEASLAVVPPKAINPKTNNFWTAAEWQAAMEATRAEAMAMRGTGDFDPNEEPSRDPWTGLYGPRQ